LPSRSRTARSGNSTTRDGGRGRRVHRAGLAKAALGGKVDGKLVDTSHRIERDAKLAIVTDKDPRAWTSSATRRRTCSPTR
jgi:hypothetical protein